MKINFMKKIITLVTLSLLISQTNAGIRQYSADIESSSWQLTDDSRLQCTLSHQIPRYGKAKFYSSASRKMNMEFELEMMRLPDSYSLAEVRSEAPNWRPGVAGRVLADMKLHKQFSPSLPKKIAWNMLNELDQGMSPTFYYNDWYSESEKITVGLSTARFQKAYQAFVSCVSNLLDFNFDDISYTVLNYQFGSDKLTKASQKRMNMIVEYLTLDSQLELVLIDGYSDSYGGRNTNLKMSERRANKVRDLIVSSGIDASRIEANGYGEKRHVASNETVIGRSKNRRVVIRMEQP
ncbi:MAG: outer membrane protein OmpA-like peptidoglycan-associated protein [Cognaticolwellia sp.]|jgi:outer membrane protein OmpA-like peptidoglycan-associated protein|tara:strand:+ start:194 stop:1075 length:882 start_codon:yes stop_codon:yes gene_type:complete